MSMTRPPGKTFSPPWGILVMLLVIGVIEGLVADHKDDRFLTLQSWTWREAGRSARKDAPNAEILGLGDSLVQLGVAAPVLTDRLGLRARILAVGGGQAPSTFFLLRRALGASTRRPAAIVVDFYPRLLELGPEYNKAHWPGFLSVGECFDLAWTSRDPILLSALITAKLFPSVDHRSAIRANIRSALAGEDRRVEHNVPLQLRRNLRENQGGVIMPRQDYAADGLEQEARPWSCHPVNAAYLGRFLALTSAARIPVFWVLPPVSPSQRTCFERLDFDTHQDRFLREQVAPFPHVTIVDARHICNDARCYVDPRHLCCEGASELSARLAEVLRAGPEPGRGRSIRLDQVAFAAAPSALEDLSSSKAIVEARRHSRR
jgi:hypothetical protein